jgi:hypothetical protein
VVGWDQGQEVCMLWDVQCVYFAPSAALHVQAEGALHRMS